MERSLRWTVWAVVCGFALLTLWTGYWSVVAGPALSAHPRNARLQQLEETIERGGIYARGGEALVTRGTRGRRSFVGDPSFAHVVGYSDVRFGQAGLERSFNRELLGLVDEMAPARAWARLTGGRWSGWDVVTTLVTPLQQAAHEALAGRPGAVVALDPHDGAILAMVSVPGFDPDRIEEALAARGDGRDPLFNRAALGQYPPGSAFKPVVLAAALAAGTVSANQTFDDPGWVSVGGRRIENSGGTAHGTLALDEALARSSNTVFAQLAAGLGPERMIEAAERLGIGRRPVLPIPTAAGNLPRREELADPAALAEVGIGQGKLLVTPLQMAVVAAAVANGGWRVTPYLVDGVRRSDGGFRAAERERPVRVMAPGIAHFVREAMLLAVTDGTAAAAAVPGVEVAGKTGTAEVGSGRPHAWFIGFAPARSPQVAVAVVVEHGGSGGAVAAPVARQVFARALSQGDALRGPHLGR